MRAMIAKPRSRHVGEPCRQCTRVIKAGQSIMVDNVPEIRFGTGATRRWHTKCVRALVESAPTGVDEFDELRDRIVTAGDAFV